MGDWAVGLSTGCFYQTSILEVLEPICSSGFNRVEICSSRSHLDYHDLHTVRRAAELLDRLGIEAYSFHAPFAEEIDITAPDPALRESSVKEVLAAVEAAARLGTRHFVIHPGPEHAERPPGNERFERLENVARSLTTIAEHCGQHGMLCLLENKLRHLLFGEVRDILWILGAVRTTQIGVCLDTGHAHLAGDLWNAAYKLAGYLRMVHASDNAGRYDDHLPPGNGQIDWSRLLHHLHASGFQGSLIMEIAGKGDRAAVLDTARRARRFLLDCAWRTSSRWRHQRDP